ncbi:MAG: pitrilysin family protein [Bacteroidales bacterium]
MPHHIIQLSNGIKLIHKEVNSPISHFGILINAGTRDENADKMGLAHFVEHTIFKGTEKRTGMQVIRRLEDVGGDLNASTSKEETYFHTSFLTPDYQRAVELLSDIFFRATFPEKEIEKEKDVVLEEIKYYQDTPAELIFDEFEDVVFAKHPLGRNILGNKKSVKSIHRNDIIEFVKQQYSLQNIVLSSVGNISCEKLTRLCEKYFGAQTIHNEARERVAFCGYVPKNSKIKKNTYQTHAVLGNLAYPFFNEKRTPFMLLTNLLGGQGMNTKLNMAIREKKGLAYSVEANYSPFSDTGLFSIYIGCDNHTLDQCINLTMKELEKLKRQPLGTMQLHYAKKQFLGQVAIANEAKLNEMLAIGRTALFFEEVETLEESIEKIEKISNREIIEVANEIFIPEQFSSLVYYGGKN